MANKVCGSVYNNLLVFLLCQLLCVLSYVLSMSLSLLSLFLTTGVNFCLYVCVCSNIKEARIKDSLANNSVTGTIEKQQLL